MRGVSKLAIVISKEFITSYMLQIVLRGESFDASFCWSPGSYVKLAIPTNTHKPIMRTYTVRHHHPNKKTITIDFAIHHPSGPATRWALGTLPGDVIGVLGPGKLKVSKNRADWYLFAADMAGLPAALSLMESLEANAIGEAFLEVTSLEDKQNLSIPKGIKVTWLFHPDPTIQSLQQLFSIQNLPKRKGIAKVFVAGEFGTIRSIRQYINANPDFAKANTYISSYWKIGAKEEDHSNAKKLCISSVKKAILRFLGFGF